MPVEGSLSGVHLPPCISDMRRRSAPYALQQQRPEQSSKRTMSSAENLRVGGLPRDEINWFVQ